MEWVKILESGVLGALIIFQWVIIAKLYKDKDKAVGATLEIVRQLNDREVKLTEVMTSMKTMLIELLHTK